MRLGMRLGLLRLNLSFFLVSFVTHHPSLYFRQDDCARLIREGKGKESPAAATALCVAMFVGLTYAAATAVLPVIPSTGCMQVFGGAGCGATDDSE